MYCKWVDYVKGFVISFLRVPDFVDSQAASSPNLEEILTPDVETDSDRRAPTAGLANFIRHNGLDSPTGGEVEKRIDTTHFAFKE